MVKVERIEYWRTVTVVAVDCLSKCRSLQRLTICGVRRNACAQVNAADIAVIDSGLMVFDELARLQSGVRDRTYLAGLVAQKRLRIEIACTASWIEAPKVIQALLDRQYTGKAVLTVG